MKNSIIERKFLDLGSVVSLDENKKSIMIVGYNTFEKKDYYGIIYPEGLITNDMIFSFEHEEIKKVLFNGFHSPLSESFLKTLTNHNKNYKFHRIQLLDINNFKVYLPIGTILFLKKAKISYMIIGYKTNKENKTDYIGIPYPTGIEIQQNIIVFNHNDISVIRYVGYKNENYVEFCKLMKHEKNNYKF